MTKKEALETIKKALPNPHAFKEELDVLEDKAKKPTERKETDIQVGEYSAYDCPTCRYEQVLIFKKENKIVGFKAPYCPHCGQHLDWSE